MPTQSDRSIQVSDLGLILEVNKKTIEIESEVALQNEVIIDHLEGMPDKVSDKISEKIGSKIDRLPSPTPQLEKLINQMETLSRELFTMKVLIVGGLLSLVMQVIQFVFQLKK